MLNLLALQEECIQADGAPEMKNHLSMLGSIELGALSSPLGMLSLVVSRRSGEWGTVPLALWTELEQFWILG